MSVFFTGKGDDGTTGLLGEGRVLKNDSRMELLGSIDEASAALGLARATCHSEKVAKIILHVQRDLYQMMAEVAATPENAEKFKFFASEKISYLEEQIEVFGKQIRMPKEFLIPGDSQGEAALALARTILRRAERRAVDLVEEKKIVNQKIVEYLNRSSSLIFIISIYEHYSLRRNNPTLARNKEDADHDRHPA